MQSQNRSVDGDFVHLQWKHNIDKDLAYIRHAVEEIEKISCQFSVKCVGIKRLQQLDQLQIQGFFQNDQNLEAKIFGSKAKGFQMVQKIFRSQADISCRVTTILSACKEYNEKLNKLLHSSQEKAKSSNQMKLDTGPFQNGYGHLMELAWQTRVFLKITKNTCQPFTVIMNHPACKNVTFDGISDLIDGFTNFIKQLVHDTFLVVRQPCHVYLSHASFPTTVCNDPLEVRLLTGPKLGLRLSPPSVSVCLVDKQTCEIIRANGLSAEEFRNVKKVGKFAPDSGRLTFCEFTKSSVACFRGFVFRDFSTSKRDLARLDDQVYLLFRLEFQVGDIPFKIWTLSLPILIKTSGPPVVHSCENVIPSTRLEAMEIGE